MLQHMGIHVVLCVLLLMLGNKSEQTCTELEVLGVSITQKEIKVKENSLFNLTVRLHKSTCHEKWNWSRVKLSSYDNGKHFDVCKVIVSNRTCNVSGWSQCVCLHQGFVQFTKWVTQEDSQIFIWRWSDSHSLTNEKEREITLFVEISQMFCGEYNSFHEQPLDESIFREVSREVKSSLLAIRFKKEIMLSKSEMIFSKPMDTSCRCYLCFIFILCRCYDCEQTCAELELQDSKPYENRIQVQENSLFKLTVYLNTFNCQGRWNWSLVRLSTYENGIHVDVCKVVLYSMTCHVTSVSSPCSCLPQRRIQFYKQITQEDNKTFIWKWSDSQSLQEEKQVEITLFVERMLSREVEEKTVSLTLLLTTTISCVCFGIIVIISVICIVRHKRHTRVRTSVPPTRGQGEEIHMYTALYPQEQRHQEEIQNRVHSSKEMEEAVGPRSVNVAKENQPNYLELMDHPDDYLEPVPIL